MMNWLQKMFYTLSGHNERIESQAREYALRSMYKKGVEIGEQHVPASVISHGTCPRHPIVLLNNRGHGDYSCMMCKEDERHTDRLPAQIYTQARRRGAGPHTAALAAAPKTIDLSKLKGDTQ